MSGVRIGTSGWTYPHWKKAFFPADLPPRDRLAFYAEKFNTVEINTTFYGTPDRATVRAWRDAVPKSFRFAVKGSRFTTHNKKLLEPVRSTRKTFRALEPIADRVCAVLFQLPPRWRFNGERLAAFLKAMPKDYRYAFEFREPSWLCDEACAILRDHQAALCLYDLKGFHTPEVTTADFVYVRLHGPTRTAYRGSYPDAALKGWAKRIAAWRAEKKEVLVYFDNDEKGYAAHDALRLRELVKRWAPVLRSGMTTWIRAGLLAILLAPAARADDALFLGNSFTFGASVPGLSQQGGVPKLVETIARAKGHSLAVESLTWPGVNFAFHLVRPATARALASQTWTWVVLQDYSTEPTRMGNVPRFMRDGVALSNRIARHSPRAGIVLYETWARPPGAFYRTSGGRQFSGPADMMADLHRSYAALAAKLAAIDPDRPVRVAPVGTAFARCRAEFPAIPLDAADHHHATQEGYYLAALVLEETIYPGNIDGAPTDFFNSVVAIPPKEAAELQHVADEIANGSKTSPESRR